MRHIIRGTPKLLLFLKFYIQIKDINLTTWDLNPMSLDWWPYFIIDDEHHYTQGRIFQGARGKKEAGLPLKKFLKVLDTKKRG